MFLHDDEDDGDDDDDNDDDDDDDDDDGDDDDDDDDDDSMFLSHERRIFTYPVCSFLDDFFKVELLIINLQFD